MTSDSAGKDPTPDFLSDCRLMLRFARRMGNSLTPELEREIADLDALLTRYGAPPISAISEALLKSDAVDWVDSFRTGGAAADVPRDVVTSAAAGTSSASATGTRTRSLAERVLKVHGELSRAVAPATALSLQTSEPPPGRLRLLGGMPLIVKFAAVTALGAGTVFLISSGVIAKRAVDSAARQYSTVQSVPLTASADITDDQADPR